MNLRSALVLPIIFFIFSNGIFADAWTAMIRLSVEDLYKPTLGDTLKYDLNVDGQSRGQLKEVELEAGQDVVLSVNAPGYTTIPPTKTITGEANDRKIIDFQLVPRHVGLLLKAVPETRITANLEGGNSLELGVVGADGTLTFNERFISDKVFQLVLIHPDYEPLPYVIAEPLPARNLDVSDPPLHELDLSGEQSALPGFLSVVSEPSRAAVHLNNQWIGLTPVEGYELSAGTYSVSIEMEGFKKQKKDDVSISSKQTTAVEFEPLEAFSYAVEFTRFIVEGQEVGLGHFDELAVYVNGSSVDFDSGGILSEGIGVGVLALSAESRYYEVEEVEFEVPTEGAAQLDLEFIAKDTIVELQWTPPLAEVYVTDPDGQAINMVEGRFFVPLYEEFAVTIRAEGFETKELVLAPREKAAYEVTFEGLPYDMEFNLLQGKVPLPSEKMANLTVSVDGRVVDFDGQGIRGIEPGLRQISIRGPGLEPISQQVMFPVSEAVEFNLGVSKTINPLDRIKHGEDLEPRRSAGHGIDLVLIKPGIASIKESRGVQLAVSRPFWMGETEITQEDYLAVTGENPSAFKLREETENASDDSSSDKVEMRTVYRNVNGVTIPIQVPVKGQSSSNSTKVTVTEVDALNHPVESVTWQEAMNFCKALTEKSSDKLPEGYVYRLPTEAEWLLAAIGPTSSKYLWGDRSSDAGKFARSIENSPKSADSSFFNSGRDPSEVKTLSPNANGVYDMGGNVEEWLFDGYQTLPPGLHEDRFVKQGTSKLVRGGHAEDAARTMLSSSRESAIATSRDAFRGFRIVLGPAL